MTKGEVFADLQRAAQELTAQLGKTAVNLQTAQKAAAAAAAHAEGLQGQYDSLNQQLIALQGGLAALQAVTGSDTPEQTAPPQTDPNTGDSGQSEGSQKGGKKTG
ncbi:MAG: hypothetical protein H6637_07800 [Ardenticatenales bacterium]|nr:hypothetical protein [Ardenticatenales bacterium]